MRLPTGHEAMKTFMDVLGQGLGENISPIGGGRNFFDPQGPLGDVVTKMVKFQGDVFSSGMKLSCPMSKRNARGVIFVDDGRRQGCSASNGAVMGELKEDAPKRKKLAHAGAHGNVFSFGGAESDLRLEFAAPVDGAAVVQDDEPGMG